MATPIRIKRSAVPGKAPSVSDLQVGELALNTYDAELYTVRSRPGIGTGVVKIGGAAVKNVIYVNKDGDDTNSGDTLGRAKATIKSAVGIASEGDVIKVSAGVYVENNPLKVAKQVSIIGDSLREVTVVPQNADQDLYHVNPGVYISDMSFTGTMNAGKAITAFEPDNIEYFAQSAYIRNCTNFVTNSIGMKIDGSKSLGPFKSMVTDSFTQYNSNGIGVSITNDGYAQIVSMFTINSDVGIFCGSGGQCDVTNSNSSFGNFGLISDGVGARKYTGILTTATAVDSDTFELDMTVPVQSIKTAEYTGDTGMMTVTTHVPHGFEIGQGIDFRKMGWTCYYGDYSHTFVSADAAAIFSGGDYTHQFVSATSGAININSGAAIGNQLDITGATYTASSGLLQLTSSGAHGMSTNDNVAVDILSLNFTCARDNYQSVHSYPRATDPIAGINTAVTVSDATNFSINVGSSPIHNDQPTNATYNPNTGDMVLTIGAHDFTGQTTLSAGGGSTYNAATGVLEITTTNPSHELVTGDYVRFDHESLTFSCSKDDHATNHAYPRVTDPTYNQWLPVTRVDANTFQCNVGISTAGDFTHTFVSAVSQGIKVAESSVGIKTEGIVFTCSKDDHATNHPYPRVSDPAYYRQMGIGATTADSITINVGVSTLDVFPSGVNGYVFEVNEVVGINTFVVHVGPNRFPHQYVSGGSAQIDVIRPFDGQVVYFDALYNTIGKVKVGSGGTGYIRAPIITIDPPSEPWGITATAVASIKNGKVEEIDIVSSGRGYTSSPNITLSAPQAGINTATATLELKPTYYSITKATEVSGGISTITISDNVPFVVGVGTTVPFYKQSRILASSHSFEYIGTGVDPVTSLPSKGAVPIQDNEVEDSNGGLTIFTSTDQTGNFRIGDGVIINQQTGTISGTFYSKSLFSTMTPFILALGGD
tara:strand:- start:644 stop:3448 length:2805 start_codon:yes stop_codon:yes gene_type:complete